MKESIINSNKSFGDDSIDLIALFKSVTIIEFGRTFGFLKNDILLVFPFGKTTYDFPPV